jgi:hypothetical protein
MAGSSAGTFLTSSNFSGVSNMEFEEDVAVIEGSLIATNKDADLGITHEENPEDIPFRYIVSEPDEVSYVCVCLLLDTCG